MLFEKGSGLVPCVNPALAALREDGTLDAIETAVALRRRGRA